MNTEFMGGGQARPSLFDNSLNLSQTLDCGQAFRWNQKGTLWVGKVGIAKEVKTLEITQENLSMITKSKFWSHYFDLELDYGEIKRDLAKISPIMKKACEFSPGIRILNQDPWEALCSFIISQNNNIKRIKGIVERMSNKYGEGGFPSADILSQLDDEELRAVGLGFRSKYISSASKLISSKKLDLKEIANANLSEARQMLMEIKGVGPKVADCALLFGFHRLECFPMDVWMKRIMGKFFPGEDGSFFGPFAGIAQQYLFNFARTSDEFKK